MLIGAPLFFISTSYARGAAPAGQAIMKCKGVEPGRGDMVQAIVGRGAANYGVGQYSFRWTASVNCRNVPGYHGPAYVLTSANGTPGMQVLPILAPHLAAGLRSVAAQGVTVQMQNHNNGLWQNFKSFTPQAANDLATQLLSHGPGTTTTTAHGTTTTVHRTTTTQKATTTTVQRTTTTQKGTTTTTQGGDTTPPKTWIFYPTKADTVVSGTEVPFGAAATDNVSVSSVIYFVDGVRVTFTFQGKVYDSAVKTPYGYLLVLDSTKYSPTRTHYVQTEAFDSAQNHSFSSKLTFTVKN